MSSISVDNFGPKYNAIDHIAIAVVDLEQAIQHYTSVLGFTLQRRLEVSGKHSGMISAELEHNGLKFVLCQGVGIDSQVSRLVANRGPGVAHIAFAVADVESAATSLSGRGLKFDTSIIKGPGLKQTFSSRNANCGLSFELIERGGEAGFLEDNVEELFAQLEQANAF